MTKRNTRRARRRGVTGAGPSRRGNNAKFGMTVFAVVVIVGLTIGFVAMVAGGSPPLAP